MSKTDLVCCLLKQYSGKLSPAEKILLEIKFITRICNELSGIYQLRDQEFKRLLKNNYNQEENMGNIKIMQEMIKDILSTNEYSLAGIANHTHIPEDVLSDVAIGINSDPTFQTSRKLFELHISLRPNLYDAIVRKIVLEYVDP